MEILEKKALGAIITASAIIIGFALLGIYSDNIVTYLFAISNNRHIPSFEELPDDVILNRTKDLPEVKAFLARYPAAWVFVDRANHFNVHHQITQEDLTSRPYNGTEYVQPYLSLKVGLDDDGYPISTVLWCTTDEHGQFKIENNIINRNNVIDHLDKEICRL